MLELQAKIKEFTDKGYIHIVNAACKYAQQKTRSFIARTHPHTAFGGKTMDDSQFIEGKFDIEADKVVATVYANYFARWYNTGAFGRIITRGKRQGIRATKYPAKGNFFEINAKAIEQYFADAVDIYLEKELEGEWLQQR